MLSAFIEAYCNNNFSQLIISGTATDTELQDAWNEILFEYSGLIHNEQSEYIFDLSKRIGLLQHHIFYIDNAIDLLRLRYDEDIINEIRAIGYTIAATFTDADYHKQLDMVISRCKTRVYELGELTDEYKRLDNTVTGKKQTEEDFLITIAALSKHQGYRINKNETTVLEFTSIFNLYLKELAHLKKQTDHG